MKIFNFRQSDYLISKGCNVKSCGYGKDKKPYIDFLSDDLFKECMKKWQNRSK